MQLVHNKTKRIFIRQTPPLPAGASTLLLPKLPDSTSHPTATQLYRTQLVVEKNIDQANEF